MSSLIPTDDGFRKFAALCYPTLWKQLQNAENVSQTERDVFSKEIKADESFFFKNGLEREQRGIANVGKTCFLTAALMCLAASPTLKATLTEHFIQHDPSEKLIMRIFQGIFQKKNVAHLMRALADQVTGTGNSTSEVVKNIMNSRNDGHDCTETIIILMKMLTTDCPGLQNQFSPEFNGNRADFNVLFLTADMIAAYVSLANIIAEQIKVFLPHGENGENVADANLSLPQILHLDLKPDFPIQRFQASLKSWTYKGQTMKLTSAIFYIQRDKHYITAQIADEVVNIINDSVSEQSNWEDLMRLMMKDGGNEANPLGYTIDHVKILQYTKAQA